MAGPNVSIIQRFHCSLQAWRWVFTAMVLMKTARCWESRNSQVFYVFGGSKMSHLAIATLNLTACKQCSVHKLVHDWIMHIWTIKNVLSVINWELVNDVTSTATILIDLKQSDWMCQISDPGTTLSGPAHAILTLWQKIDLVYSI